MEIDIICEMQSYELTLVLPEKATSAKKKSVSELVEKLASTYKGKVKKTEDWGKIDLAYEIAKNTSGNFLHFVLELEPPYAKDIEGKIKMEEGIIRHLMVRQEGKKVKE